MKRSRICEYLFRYGESSFVEEDGCRAARGNGGQAGGRGREEGAHLVDLHGRVLRDDTRSTTRRVEENSVEAAHDLGELATVVIADDDVLAPEAVDVGGERLGAGLVGVVGEDETGVLEEGGDVGRLAAGGGGHVEHALVGLRGEGDDGEEGGGGLEHVVTSKVLRSSA